MNRGIYQVLSGALTQEQRLHRIAHNTANVNTKGFKRGDAVFGALMAKSGLSASGLRRAEGALGSSSQLKPQAVPYVFARITEYRTDFTPGRVRETSDPLHLALQSEGFFEIRTPDGPRYTRNGMFRLDTDRRLVTEQGHPVMGSNGELKLPPGKVIIGNDGTIEVRRTGPGTEQAAGRKVGVIKVVTFDDLSQLQEVGDSFFLGQESQPVKEPSIAAGHIEDSNVNAMEEMVKMIEVNRIYESAQKLLQTFDRLTDVAIREIGNTA